MKTDRLLTTAVKTDAAPQTGKDTTCSLADLFLIIRSAERTDQDPDRAPGPVQYHMDEEEKPEPSLKPEESGTSETPASSGGNAAGDRLWNLGEQYLEPFI